MSQEAKTIKTTREVSVLCDNTENCWLRLLSEVVPPGEVPKVAPPLPTLEKEEGDKAGLGEERRAVD